MAFEPLTRYANPPTNVLGTTFFLSYILAALYLTSTTIQLLYRQSKSTSKSKSSSKSRNAAQSPAKSLVVLSFISFATLSYHMLKFLLISHAQWSLNKTMFKPDDKERGVWNWMLESTLFESFARELVSDGPSTVWTQVGLLGTWFWNVWIADTAKEKKLKRDEIVKFIALGQILPISFTATLFAIYLQLNTRKDMKSAPKPANAPKKSSKESPKQPSKASSPPRPAPKLPLILSTVFFNMFLLALPSLRHSSYFIFFVLFTRVALLLPHFGITGARSEDEWISAITLSGGFVVANVNLMTKGYGLKEVVGGLSKSGEAVKALGRDAALGMGVAALLVFMD